MQTLDVARTALLLCALALVPVPVRASDASVRIAGQGLDAELRDGGALITLETGDRLQISFQGLGRGSIAPLPPLQAPRSQGGEVGYPRGPGVLEWWRDDEGRIEHGITIDERPAGEGPLSLAVAIDGDLHAAEAAGDRALLADPRGEIVASYHGLVVVDRDARRVPAEMRLEGGRVRIDIDDRGARYPLIVDPVVAVEEANLGHPMPAADDYFDWLEFAGPYRAWGAEGSATPDCYAGGPCSPSSMGTRGCQIYDYTLRAEADEFLLGASLVRPTGDEVLTADFEIGLYGAVPDEAACTRAFSGASVVPPEGARTFALCRVAFLDHARELLADAIGNDNLLCESGETCLYTPNIASYQGHGPLVPSRGGPFVDGVITGVTLVEHETNGVLSPFRP